MAYFSNAIFSFSSGVMTPRISSRADTDKFNSALTTGKNWIVTPQGGGVFRQGFEYIEETAESRIFQFHRGGNESDVIVEILPTTTYQAGIIHFHVDGVTASIPNVVGHSYTSAELQDLYFTNQEEYGIICHPAHPPFYIEWDLYTGTFEGYELPVATIPPHDYRDINSPTASPTTEITYTLSFTDGDIKTWKPGKGFRFQYNNVVASGSGGKPIDYQYAADLTSQLTDALSRIPELNGSGTTYSVAVSGTSPTTPVVAIYDIIISGQNSGRIMQLRNTNIDADRFVEVVTTSNQEDIVEAAWSYPTVVFHSANYYQCISPNFSETGVNEPPDTDYWTDLGTTKPDTFDYQYPDGNLWITENIYYPGGRGFPAVCVFHGPRAVLASSPQASTTIWGSRIGFYRDFKLGINDDDPWTYTLDTSDSPRIKWMISQLDLVVGSSAGDWTISAEVTITPTDIQVTKQNYARSYASAPVAVDNDVFYIEQGGNKLRMTRYERQKLGFNSTDVSLGAEHLFHVEVKRIVILRTPEVLMLILRTDGTLVSLTYTSGELAAYTEIESEGHILDIAGYYSTETNEDSLYVITSYNYTTDPGQGFNYYLENMPYPSRTMTPFFQPFFGTVPPTLTEQGVVLMDSWIERPCVDNIITGLEHFDRNTEVGVTVNDAWVGIFPVLDGTVNLTGEPGDNEIYNGVAAVGAPGIHVSRGRVYLFEQQGDLFDLGSFFRVFPGSVVGNKLGIGLH